MKIDNQSQSKFLSLPVELRAEIYGHCSKGALAALEATCKLAQVDVNPSGSGSKCGPWLEMAKREFPRVTRQVSGSPSVIERLILEKPKSMKTVYKDARDWCMSGKHLSTAEKRYWAKLQCESINFSFQADYARIGRQEIADILKSRAEHTRKEIDLFLADPDSSAA